MSERLYPIRPLPEDTRFGLAVLADVADVLAEHGYPTLAGPDYAELQQALARFLYGEDTATGGESTRPEQAPAAEVRLTALGPVTLSGCSVTELEPDFYGRQFVRLAGQLPAGWRADEFADGTEHMEYAHAQGLALPAGINVQVAVAYGDRGPVMTIEWLKERSG